MKAVSANPFITAVADAVGASLRPDASPEMKQMAATSGHRILARLSADAHRLPALQNEAMDAYRDWLAAARPLLRPKGGDALAVDLDTCLERRDYAGVEAAVQAICGFLAADASQPGGGKELRRRAASIEQKLESAMLAAYNEMLSGSQGKNEAGEKEVFDAGQKERLTQWLRGQFPACPHLAIARVKGIWGGFSKQTVFIHLAEAPGVPETLVMRMDWTGGPVTTTVRDEFPIIKALFDAGIEVPRPYAQELTATVVGEPFLLLGLIEGANIGDAVDVTAGGKSIALDMARAMAKYHRLPPEVFGDRVDGANVSTRDRMLAEFDKYERGWRDSGVPSITLEIAFAWLKENIDLAEGPRSLIHRDIGPHNLMAAEGRLTGVIDWELAAIGAPAQDLGYAYPFVIQMCDWREFIAAYAEAGGLPPPQERIDYYTLWTYTWTMSNLVKARTAFAAYLASDIRLAYVEAYLSIRFHARLAEHLKSLV